MLDLKIDIVFQELFGAQKNAKITSELLSLILNKEIKNIDLDVNKRMLGNRKDSKTGRLDIRAKFNDGEDCDIELQVEPDEIELHILELPKLRNTDIDKDKLALWLKFIQNPSNKEVQIKMEEEENKLLKQAKEELAYLSGDPDFKRLVEARVGFLRDQNTAMLSREEKGKKEKAVEIAKKLLNMNMPKEQIAEVTGLSIREIEKLKK